MKIDVCCCRLQSVANFRAHVLSRTSISPNVTQRFRWIGGQWQQQFPSPRDRVAPPTATPHRRRQSLPSRLAKDGDTGLTARHRAILLRSSVQQQRAPTRPRPTGTAVRFDDVTSNTAKQLRGPAYQQPVHAHQQHAELAHLAQQPVGQTYSPQGVAALILGQRIETPIYHTADSAYQHPGPANQPPSVVHGRPYPGDVRHAAAVQHGEQALGVEYGPAWSHTMAVPMSRSEATLSFTQKPQTHGPAAPTSQLQMTPPQSPIGRTISVWPRPPATLQHALRSTEPAGAGPMGGATSTSPRPPTGGQPPQRPTELAGAALAQRRETLRQKKLAVIEKSDSVDEDEFDKLVAINYKQLVDSPPTPTGSASLAPPVTADPRRSPKVSPRLARRPSPAEQATPPVLSTTLSRQGDKRQELKTEEESEDELSK